MPGEALDEGGFALPNQLHLQDLLEHRLDASNSRRHQHGGERWELQLGLRPGRFSPSNELRKC